MRVAGIFLGSIPILIQLYFQKYRQEDLSKTMDELENEYNIPTPKTYDFIIVGGGTAGCVLAGRLSENFNVLLLEAGGSPPPAAEVPYFTASVFTEPNINYFFKPTSIISGSQQDIHKTIPVVTGKMLGGSGSHNCLAHNRGSPYDFDHWADLLNDSSWYYDNVLWYFKKSDNFVGESYGPNDAHKFYGKGGPINLEPSKNAFLEPWLQAGIELGFETNDPNGYQSESFSPLILESRNGKRSSSYSEYIKPFEKIRKNLTVIRYANVSEIILDNNKMAYGVAYSRHDIFPQIAHASKEVIISAGAFSSPLLLMKSGIGPVKTLEAAEIPVKIPLEAVGRNLGEHAAVTLQLFAVNDTSIFPKLQNTEKEQYVKQFREGDGLLSGCFNGGQLLKVSSKSDNKDWPDIYIKASPPLLLNNEDATANFSIVLGRPKSRGVVSLNTEKYKQGVRDDTELAMIDFELLSHPDDIEVLVEGIQFIFDITEKTNAFQRVNMTYVAGPISACSDYVFRSDDYWRCFIKSSPNSKARHWTHMVGTCGMGPENGNSDDSVVDNKFRVRGARNLRVIDASVFPSPTNANPNAPIIMLAEKAADEIKKFWSLLG